MVEHTDEIQYGLYKQEPVAKDIDPERQETMTPEISQGQYGKLHPIKPAVVNSRAAHAKLQCLMSPKDSQSELNVYEAPLKRLEDEKRINSKIQDRLHAIIEEYEEKIRECTMRVDGMAMSTQWVCGANSLVDLTFSIT
jgi:hypothetical protein